MLLPAGAIDTPAILLYAILHLTFAADAICHYYTSRHTRHAMLYTL